ncbi:four helix bundle protein [Roseibacillus ishigakijimensis]|uniref:Four helix bundle protein n=1 Tax=Roseibacillus ishigakijimensis TaxID=454146 RepID=A0A934RQI7_9BACT|nr:four helix bundle protein [Roseibacillus ishigakijimensis]MBK1833608.1 four helix bundle protein [Roseibacillus ishigakijimensis]
MPESKKGPYDLEGRTFEFAVSVRRILARNTLPPVCWADSEQILRSSGSVGANYIEANSSISHRDKLFRMKIARKEAAESKHWARLLQTTLPTSLVEEMRTIEQEADELMRILSAILKKLEAQHPPE